MSKTVAAERMHAENLQTDIRLLKLTRPWDRRDTLDGGELGPESLLGVMVTQVS